MYSIIQYVGAALSQASAREMAARAGCARRTAYRWLHRMFKLQLVGRDGSRWWACPERLDDVACYYETHRIPARRRARIARERAARTVGGWRAAVRIALEERP